jgi:hypothetical protein
VLFCGIAASVETRITVREAFDILNHQEKAAMPPNTASDQWVNVEPAEI